MIEEWRPIEGYEGLYEVSSYGRVRSLDMYVKSRYGNYRLHKGKVLSPRKDKNGYLAVFLYCNGKQKKINIHRLVAQAFILNTDNLPEVNHKDEVKTNNKVDNLEWCDHKYNMNFGTIKDKIRESKLKSGFWTGLSQKEYRKKWCQENKDKIKEYNKEYNKEYYEKNKDKIKDRTKENYQENKEKILMQKKEYRRKKKEIIQNNV